MSDQGFPRAWIVSVYVPTCLLPGVLARWGDRPTLVTMSRYPEPDPEWGTFVWVSGFAPSREEDPDWVDRVLDDPIANLQRVPQRSQHFASSDTEAPGVFYGHFIETDIPETEAWDRARRMVEDGSWRVLEQNLLQAYRTSEDIQYELAKMADEMIRVDIERKAGLDRLDPADRIVADDIWAENPIKPLWTVLSLTESLNTALNVVLDQFGAGRYDS
jgi:hypothetical protein